jgi:L-asparaginase II
VTAFGSAASAPNGTFDIGTAVELVVVERSGFIESRHVGSAIVLAPDGSVARSLGDPNATIFPRSALKPFQAIAAMTSGATLSGAEAAIATGSHVGTPAHVDAARRLLAMAGLSEGALQCPVAWPRDSATRDDVIRSGENRRAIYMNCSGKHAAMLLACTVNGWSIENYLDPQHPLQQHIKDVVERLTGEKVTVTGVDGCGAPVYAVSLNALARGIQKIAMASASSPFALYRAAATLFRAALDNGWAIEGPGRQNSVVIDDLGVFAKLGAEGVMVMAAPDGTTVALKLLDGELRGASLAALELLVRHGALDRASVDAVLPKLGLAVRGGSTVVGQVRLGAAFD